MLLAPRAALLRVARELTRGCWMALGWLARRRFACFSGPSQREHLYTKAQLEAGKTADHLWNASQKQLVHLGKIHGFMRMYWAKKILEWTESTKARMGCMGCMRHITFAPRLQRDA